MANWPNDTDKELIKQVRVSKLSSLYYYPIGAVDELRRTKLWRSGNTVNMPAISSDLDAKLNDSNIYSTHIYYLGFSLDEEIVEPKNKILDKNGMANLNAKMVASSLDILEFHTDHKAKIINTSGVFNQKFGTDLTWIAFFGFDVVTVSCDIANRLVKGKGKANYFFLLGNVNAIGKRNKHNNVHMYRAASAHEQLDNELGNPYFLSYIVYVGIEKNQLKPNKGLVSTLPKGIYLYDKKGSKNHHVRETIQVCLSSYLLDNKIGKKLEWYAYITFVPQEE